MAKPVYPYTEEQTVRSDKLMAELQILRAREEVVRKELLSIIYSIEKPR